MLIKLPAVCLGTRVSLLVAATARFMCLKEQTFMSNPLTLKGLGFRALRFRVWDVCF